MQTTRVRHRKRNSYKRVHRNRVLLMVALCIVLVIVIVRCTACENHADDFTTKTDVVETESAKAAAVTETTVMEEEEFKEVMYTTEYLRFRAAPSVNSEVLDVIPSHYLLEVTYTDCDAWYHTYYNGLEGYVSPEYLHEYRKDDYSNIDLEYYYQDLVADMLIEMDMDVDKYFIFGMMWVEDRFSSNTESYAGARGIMQIMPSTWENLYPMFVDEYPQCAWMVKDDIDDKQSNIIIGMYCLKVTADVNNLDSINENRSRILTTYNRGEGGARKYYQSHGTYMSDYSESVLSAAEEIRTTNTIAE